MKVKELLINPIIPDARIPKIKVENTFTPAKAKIMTKIYGKIANKE
jgi:hypothetical protein